MWKYDQGEAANGESSGIPLVSNDGCRVAFKSSSANLVDTAPTVIDPAPEEDEDAIFLYVVDACLETIAQLPIQLDDSGYNSKYVVDFTNNQGTFFLVRSTG